ncbi:hypothetical protein [Parafrankia sp. FMc2]|uniref:hypothetical protein n=1 Tax=Parafrankia sp. FMc2 TaxID=3233196 RepID=UPI0034D49F99
MTEAGNPALAEMLRFVSRTVPYYLGLPDATHVSPQDADAVLRSLPLLERSHVRDQKVRLWSSRGDSSAWSTVRTTGTTGVPLELAVDRAAQRAEMDALAHQISLVRSPAVWLDGGLTHLTLHASSTSRSQPSFWSPRGTLTKWNFGRAWHLPPASLDRSLRHLHQQVVTGMPSVLDLVAERARECSPVRPHAVVLAGETIRAGIRERLRDIFDCPVTSLYTLAEFGVVGHGCLTTDDYHVNDRDVVMEILDPTQPGTDRLPGLTGEIVVTGLANRAMPLVRYRTNDRGHWSDGPSCGCPLPGRRFRITSARTLQVVATGASGRQVTDLDLCKILAHLGVQGARVDQVTPTGVVLTYEAEHALRPHIRDVATRALRRLLGPGMTVTVRCVAPEPTRGSLAQSSRHEDFPARHPGPVAAASGAAAPQPTEADEILSWARHAFARIPDVLAAVLTGSVLDPVSRSRFSDIDVLLLVRDPRPERWLEVTRLLHSDLPGLRINVTDTMTLESSALVLSRILAERVSIVGNLDDHGLRRPDVAQLHTEARFWAQDAQAVLWTHASAVDLEPDPLLDALTASRYMLDAYRYHYLLRGGTETAASVVLAAAERDRLPHSGSLRAAFEISREHRPPPTMESEESRRLLVAALSCVRGLLASAASGLATSSPGLPVPWPPPRAALTGEQPSPR